jgi:hypothetical protein
MSTDSIIAATVVTGAAFDLSARRPPQPVAAGRRGVTNRHTATSRPPTTGLLGPAVVLGCYWAQIGRRRWIVAGGLGAAWVASRPYVVSSPRALLEESLWLLELFFASKDFQGRVLAERELLSATLVDEFDRRRHAMLRHDVEAELDRLEEELRVAERELAIWQHELGPDIAADLAAECDGLRAWLSDPATAQSMLS